MAKSKKSGGMTGKKASSAPIKPGRVYSAPSGSKKSGGMVKKGGKSC